MFTGLVEGLGTVVSTEMRGTGCRLVVAAPESMDVAIGDSVAMNGCCLTVVEIAGRGWSFDLGDETLKRTNLGELRCGDGANLERALAANARLGGHFVQGHVDGRGTVAEILQSGEWTTMVFRIPEALSRYMVEKGSIAVDGVSLTIVESHPDRFSVMLIPHTLASTTLGRRKVGDSVNLEVDLLAKYVEKLVASHLMIDSSCEPRPAS
jgi:riboflavin synthase